MEEESKMKISVENYGPIAEAKDVELCPLTVFVGPSNTGKSYLAILIYALFQSFGAEGGFSERFYRIPKKQIRNRALSHTDIKDTDIETFLKELFRENIEDIKFSDFSEEFQQWTSKEIAKAISQNFHQEISRCMGTSTKEIHLIGDGFNLNLNSNQKNLTLGPLGKDPSMEIKELNFSGEWFANLRRYIISRRNIPKVIEAEVLLDQISARIFHRHSGRESFYLPAARTGIMQSHRAMVGALVKRAASVGLETLSVPALSGIISDFLEEIILIHTREIYDADVGKVADEMEKNILHGSIKPEDFLVKILRSIGQESSLANQYPELLYKQNGFEVPLLRSSSMVTELAPIVLFLRHRVRKGDLLIIEEPEAHLHPEAQRKIAGTLVRLIRAGVRVMATTHSDYFLEQIGNYVRQSKLREAKGEKLTGSTFPFLKEDEIGAYVFNQKEKGTIVERLHFDQENGLSPEDHEKVSSDLYNETVEILEQIDETEHPK